MCLWSLSTTVWSAMVVLELSESVLCGRDDVVCCEVVHDLGIDEGVEHFRNDGEEGDRAVEFGEGSVFLFEEFYYFGYFEGVWIIVFVDALVVESGQDRC